MNSQLTPIRVEKSCYSGLVASLRKRSPVRRAIRHRIRRARNFIIGLVAPVVIRSWMSTLRVRWCGQGIRRTMGATTGRIYVLWHERLLVFLDSHRNIQARMLISSHGDGQMLASVGSRFGFKPMRGSSTRGGMRAVRELLRDTKNGFDYGLTPDGPRGPRKEFKSGAIYFASRSGLPIVPTTVSYSKCWRLPTWDRFVIPRPFARSVVQFGEEIQVPAKLDANGLETWRQRLESTLCDLSDDTESHFEEHYRGGIPQQEGLALQNNR